MSRWIWFLLASALALGCGKKEDPGPPCSQVADHVAEVTSKAYPGHADMMPAGARKAWVATCESRNLTAKQRRCMMEAQTPDGLASCIRDRTKPDEAAPARPGAPPARPGAPAATPPAAPPPGAPPPAPPAATPPAAPADTAPTPAPATPAAPAPAPR